MLKLIYQHNRCFLLCCADLSWDDCYITLEWDKYCQGSVCLPNNLRWKSCWPRPGIRFLLIRGNSWRINVGNSVRVEKQSSLCWKLEILIKKNMKENNTFQRGMALSFEQTPRIITSVLFLIFLSYVISWDEVWIALQSLVFLYFISCGPNSWFFGQAGKNSVSDLNRVSFFLSCSCHRPLLHWK